MFRNTHVYLFTSGVGGSQRVCRVGTLSHSRVVPLCGLRANYEWLAVCLFLYFMLCLQGLLRAASATSRATAHTQFSSAFLENAAHKFMRLQYTERSSIYTNGIRNSPLALFFVPCNANCTWWSPKRVANWRNFSHASWAWWALESRAVGEDH